MSGDLTSAELRKKFKSIWSDPPPNAEWYREGLEPALRIHRAISWVERAEKETDDLDARFIFYWIAFNAAYAQRKKKHANVKSWELYCIDKYFDNVLRMDVYNRISDTVGNIRSNSIMNIIENRFIFREWWNFHKGAYDRGMDDWERSPEKKNFISEMKKVKNASNNPYGAKDALKVLFNRLYIMRNQLIHGGSSWDSCLSRDQTKYGVSIMNSLIPLFICVMMNDRNQYWGSLDYPRIKPEQLGLGSDEEFPIR